MKGVVQKLHTFFMADILKPRVLLQVILVLALSLGFFRNYVCLEIVLRTAGYATLLYSVLWSGKGLRVQTPMRDWNYFTILRN